MWSVGLLSTASPPYPRAWQGLAILMNDSCRNSLVSLSFQRDEEPKSRSAARPLDDRVKQHLRALSSGFLLLVVASGYVKAEGQGWFI